MCYQKIDLEGYNVLLTTYSFSHVPLHIIQECINHIFYFCTLKQQFLFNKLNLS